jgi:F-type H+-transporting ATPase subunit delta
MATNRTLATPYAEAAFEYACKHNVVTEWQDMLTLAANLVKNEQIQLVLNHPSITQEKKIDLFLELLKNTIDKHRKNFILLLANKKRLQVLPEIMERFIALRKEKDKTISVILKSAFPVDQDQQEHFKKALKIRLQADIELHVQEDKSLIGGVKIYADDLVIDGSVKTQLERLKQTLFA